MEARVAIYTRLSVDRTGEQTATARQEAACRSFAEARGWQVVEVFEDVDLSAFAPAVVRPAFDRLRRAVEAGLVGGVLVWKLDRLVRRPADFERFWASCQRGRVFLASVTEPVDSSTDIGLAIVRVLVTFASLESATRGVRIRAKAREQAKAGQPWRGHRPFGHTKDWQALVPDEAAAIRDAAHRVLAGDTLSAIARHWAETGVRTTGGGLWPTNKLMPLLCAARMVGDRSFNGEVVAHDCFPPILGRLTHLRLRRLAATRSGFTRGRLVERLLSGLLVCGICGHGLYSSHDDPERRYTCPPAPIGCRGVSVSALHAEPWATDAVLARLKAQPPPPKLMCHRDMPRYAELVERLEQLHYDFHVQAALTRADYLNCRAALDARVAALAAATNLPVLEQLPYGFDLRFARSAWPALTIVQQRAIIASQVAHITVDPVHRGGGGWRPSRLHIHWAE